MSRANLELPRGELIKLLDEELGRKASMAMLLFYTALADRLHLNLTDLLCGELLSRTGPLTAGELAQLVGLTTGAITGVIDRLERVGYVRRENDSQDRRRVIVRAVPEAWAKTAAPLFKNLNQKFVQIFEGYSDEELAVIANFMSEISEAYDQEAAQFRNDALAQRQDAREESAGNEAIANLTADANFRIRANARIRIGEHHEHTRNFAAPLESRTQARLELEGGALGLSLRPAHNSSELYAAQFHGDIPTVRVEGDTVTMRYRQQTLFGKGGGRAELALNDKVAWEIALRCGVSHIEGDLRGVPLRALNITSDTSKLRINLPPPTGTVTVKIEASRSSIALQRPRGIPVRLQAEGETSRLHFDNERKSNITNDARESADYKRATNRYLIQISGGMNKIEISEK